MSVLRKFNSWKNETGQHGPRALPRFIMLIFTEELCSNFPNFIFKGGNLLWLYINTPRSTVDLDFSTKTTISKQSLIEKIESIKVDGVDFKIKSIEVREKGESKNQGAMIKMIFTLETGQQNEFGIDIVFGSNEDTSKIKILNKEATVVSLENIICDKISACHEYRSGNTRMKDYDDLYRLTNRERGTWNRERLEMINLSRNIDLKIPMSYATESMNERWKRYLKQQYRNKADIPDDIGEVIDFINKNIR